jgi:hypothetical protein
MSEDWGRPARDDFQDWRESVDRDWIRRERLERLDEQAAKDEPAEDREDER